METRRRRGARRVDLGRRIYSCNIHQKRSTGWWCWWRFWQALMYTAAACLLCFNGSSLLVRGTIINSESSGSSGEGDGKDGGLLWQGKIPFLKGNLNGNFEDTVVAAGEKLDQEEGQPIPADSSSNQLRAGSKSRAASTTTTTHHYHQKLRDRVHEILRTSPLIDGHNDLPWNIRKFIHGQINEFNFSLNLRRNSIYPWSNSSWSHTDIPRMRAGLVAAQFWVAYVPCEAQYLNAVQITLEQIDLIRRLVAKYPNDLTLALSPDDILQAHREGKIASLIAVEGGHSIGNSLATLRTFYDLGVRAMTLTHSCNTPWADSSLVEAGGHKPQFGGLTEFGRSVVREMNRLGMLVDLSHTSKMTMKDALNESQAPVIFSHSSAYAICNSSRNVPDDILKELVWNRGIVMVTFYNYFVKCRESASVRDVADHINYIRDKIGVKHIGIGAGFDGINKTPLGLEDTSTYPNLFMELAKDARWTDDELKKVAGLNFLKVFREAEHVRDKMRNQTASYEQISPRYLRNRTRCKYNDDAAKTAPSPRVVH